MKSKLLGGLAAAGVLAFGGVAFAQSEGVYENGPVWRVSAVATKPGMFDAYMKYLSGTWRQIQEAGMKRGDVLGYKVMVEDSPREHEPNVYLMVEYKNMAVFDRSQKEADQQMTAAFGSVQKAQEGAIAREAMRETKGMDLLREIHFTN